MRHLVAPTQVVDTVGLVLKENKKTFDLSLTSHGKVNFAKFQKRLYKLVYSVYLCAMYLSAFNGIHFTEHTYSPKIADFDQFFHLRPHLERSILRTIQSKNLRFQSKLDL